MRVSNPYIYAAAQAKYGAIPLDEMRGKLETAADAEAMRRLIDRYMLARDRLVARYSWAIPNVAALRALAAAAPLIEIGAGNGYWAALLRQMGVDILAFDANPPLDEAHTNEYSRNALAVGQVWTDVQPGGPELAAQHPDRTLFLCWPPPHDPMAYEALEAYRKAGGRRLAYVGEFFPVCGDAAFEATLMGLWRPVAGVDIPRWFGMKDALTFWEL